MKTRSKNTISLHNETESYVQCLMGNCENISWAVLLVNYIECCCIVLGGSLFSNTICPSGVTSGRKCVMDKSTLSVRSEIRLFVSFFSMSSINYPLSKGLSVLKRHFVGHKRCFGICCKLLKEPKLHILVFSSCFKGNCIVHTKSMSTILTEH